MKCKCCGEEIPDDMEVCRHCGVHVKPKNRSWHYLHALLWGNERNQDLLETLNEFNREREQGHFVDMTHKLHQDMKK